MAVYKSNRNLKSGKQYFFKLRYTVPGTNEKREKHSGCYETRVQAAEAEQKFIMSLANYVDVPAKMTFKDLYEKFLEDRKGKVKFTTYQAYPHMQKYIEMFMNVKCANYNIKHYAAWVQMMSTQDISLRYKNDILKFFKSILNYGSNWYGFNFDSTYRKMDKFKSNGERKKEMLFYTLDEFKQFISKEDNLRYKALWTTLYYCGLRCGESRGLTWNDIDFDNKILTVNKQVQDTPKGYDDPYVIVSPKTRTSNRKIPICDDVVTALQEYKEYLIDNNVFDTSNFVFGDQNGKVPCKHTTMAKRKNDIAALASVKQIRLHDFRHSCASLLINNGGNVTLVAKYLGHSEIEETLNTYSHMFPTALDSVMNIINETTKKSK